MSENLETFEQVISYLEHFTNLEKSPDKYSSKTYRTDKMRAILKLIGNPETCFKSIHVAGSKGKGSTSAMLANSIQALGYKCGLYASPHLTDYRERFTLAGKFFKDEFLIKTGNQLKSYLDNYDFSKLPGNQPPTVFELFTAYAYLLFKNSGCDYAVIETGLGGRLDATNTLCPVACVLTPVELEHTAILGNTITEIATEKSKIITEKTPCFVSFQKEDAEKVFTEEAKANKSPLYLLRDYVSKIQSYPQNEKQITEIKWQDGTVSSLNLSLLGRVQADNAALSLLILKKLNLYKEGITEKAVENTILPGRFEKILSNPPFFIDGAHTISSISNLLFTFKQMFPGKDNTVIFGCLPDKKVMEITDLIVENFDNIIVSRPGTFKKNNPKEIFDIIQEKIKNTSKTAVLIEDAKEAVRCAIKTTKNNSAILATGSFYLSGDIKEALATL